MSTFIGETQPKPIRSEEDLTHYFQGFAKSRSAIRVGLEAEFFAVDRETGKALPYEGLSGIHQILKALARRFQYEPILEEGNIIGLRRGTNFISLEPGGQVELSAPPVSNVFEIEDQIQSFLSELRSLHEEMPSVQWLAVGIQPFSRLEEITWVPKKRYAIMADYLGKHGSQSHHMMKRTATNQVNFDYTSEENAMESLRAVLGITSIVTAMFANSSFSDGAPNGYLSKRLDIWNHTDPDRTGLLIAFTREGKTFQDYLSYLLDMPIMFIVREGRWIPFSKMTFREFMQKGTQGVQATLGDFELHLSTAFPEARLKQYLEIRGIDGQSPDLIAAVAAFWKGILYCQEAREAAWKLVSFASESDRLRLHQEVPRKGLSADLGGKPIFSMAKELVEISCHSLAMQKKEIQSKDECIFLERIRAKIIRPKKSPAESLLAYWENEAKRDPLRLLNYMSI